MKCLFFLILLAVANAKIFQRCEWALELKNRGLDGFSGVSLANWVCLTRWESDYNTKAINHNTDGSTDYGIFQINSRYWCHDTTTPGHTYNECNINCSELQSDDVTASVNCAKRIVRQQGISAWYGWLNNCKGQDVSTYLAGCGL
ncbi:lysozyme C-like [Pholidichthys leucotaenia]